MVDAILFDAQPPQIYVEYKLKEKFGWTQEELENESATDIGHYLLIMNLESKRKTMELNKNNG